MSERKKGGKTNMERILPTILCLLMVSLPSINSLPPNDFTDEICLSFSPDIYTVHINGETFSVVSIENAMANGVLGEPLMLSYSSHLLVRPDQKPMSIEIDRGRPTSFYLSDALLPFQPEVPMSEEAPPFLMNEKAYGRKGSLYPREGIVYDEVKYKKGFPIMHFTVNVTDYIPAENKLLVYEKVTVRITYDQVSPLCDEQLTNIFYRNTEQDRGDIAKTVENPEALTLYISGGETPLADLYPGGICDSSESYDYVIITNESLADTQGETYNWSDLLDHRYQRDGLSGIIVTVQDIYACEDYWNTTELFNDSAALVREFCKDAYLDWGTEYVLLGGTWEVDKPSMQIVPCRIFTNLGQPDTQPTNTMASDLYFSNLDGDWWYESSAIWGGGANGNNDKYSELAVGRVPIWNAEQISNFIEKVFWYDSYDNLDWLRSAAFAAPKYLDSSGYPTGREYMEELRRGDGSYATYVGFEEWNSAFPEYEIDTSHRYYREDYSSDAESKNAWRDAINSNSFSMISHDDHGSRLNTISMVDGRDLNNSKYFIGTSQACFSGQFHRGECGAYYFLALGDLTYHHSSNWGAFAMVLNTGYGYYNMYSTTGSSQLQHKIFWDYYFNDQANNLGNWRIGDAMRYTKDVYADQIGSIYSRSHVWYGWSLFGDPAQQLKLNSDEDVQVFSVLPKNETSESQLSPLCSVTVQHKNGSLMDVSFASPLSGDWTNYQTNSSIGNGTYTWEFSGANEYLTTYHWRVYIDDGVENVSEDFSFETLDGNYPPTLSAESPTNNSILITLQPIVNITVNDVEGDTMNITFASNHTGSWVNYQTNSSVGNGTYQWQFSDANSYDTKYYWQVYANDGETNISGIYEFTTEQTNNPPVIGSPNPSNDSVGQSTNLTWSCTIEDGEGDLFDWSIECSDGQTNYSDIALFNESASYGGTIYGLDTDEDYIYAVGGTTDRVRKYWKSNLTYVGQTDWISDDCDGIVLDDSYIYVAAAGGEKCVKKYWKDNLSYAGESITFGSVIVNVDVDDNYVYAAGPSEVLKLWKTNLTEQTKTPDYGGTTYGLTIDDDYVYVGGLTNQTVKQYWKTNMSLKAFSPGYGGNIRTLANDDTYVYTGGYTTNAVRKYWKSNMSFAGESDSYGNTVTRIALDTNYIYAGGSTVGTVHQYWKSNMSKKAETPNYGNTIWAMHFEEPYLYIGGYVTETIWKLSDMDTNGTKSISLTNLSYDTTYTIWVNASDSNSSSSAVYYFTTEPSELMPYVDDMGFTLLSNHEECEGTSEHVDIGDTFFYNIYASIVQTVDTIAVRNLTFLPGGIVNVSGPEDVDMRKGDIMDVISYFTSPWEYENGVIDNESGYAHDWVVISTATISDKSGVAFNIEWYAYDVGEVSLTIDGAVLRGGEEIPTQNVSTTVYVHPKQPSMEACESASYQQIDISWIKGNGATHTLIRYKTDGYPTSVTDGTQLYNGTGASTQHTGIDEGQTIYYSIWSYANGVYSQEPVQSAMRTNSSVAHGPPSLENRSTDQIVRQYWNISISDPDGDLFNWTIECSNGQNSSGTIETNGTKSLYLILQYNENYTIWVNSTDSQGSMKSTNSSYWFETKSNVIPDSASMSTPTNNSNYESVYTNYLNVSVSDPDGDDLKVTYYLSNGSIIGIVPSVSSGSTASLLVGRESNENDTYKWLNHNTTYQWYAIVDDLCELTGEPIEETGNISTATWNFHTSMAVDVNEDRVANYLDLSIIGIAYGQASDPAGRRPEDVNEDGTISGPDISAVITSYGLSW